MRGAEAWERWRLERRLRRYLAGGRVPWSKGYTEHRDRLVARALSDPALLEAFRTGARLPEGYAERVDERAVELPWAVAHLDGCGLRLVDAGSALNHRYLLEHPALAEREVVLVTLAPEGVVERPKVSYLYADLRSTPLRDGWADVVCCISTLEHVGMDNTRFYTADQRFAERDRTAYRQVVTEMRRILAPGGVLLLTVPFGRPEDHGWLQQFDAAGIESIAEEFGGAAEARYYRHSPAGWQVAAAEECAGCSYFDVHSAPGPAEDGAAAARAVCCLRAVRR